MNTSMYNHPSTQASLRKLEEWKVVILPTDEGYLACGDIGKGKLLEPDKIFEIIMEHLQKRKPDMAKGKILITSGGTKENIDGVRYISNLSTGRTGSSIANYFSNNGWDVTFLLSENSVIPLSVNSKIFYTDYNTLKIKLLEQISSNFFDAIIHLAAVSDFKVDSVEYEGKRFNSPLTEKIPSSVKDVKITLTPTSKLVDGIKQKSKNEKIILTAFKFTTNTGLAAKIEVDDLFNRSNADFIVLNHPSGRTSGCEQRDFQIFDKYKKIDKYPDGPKLAEELEKLIISRLKKIGDSNASLS
jgi:phosphopantothenoylcysteine decarboxylase/phosphopantothenate--cysteine ligase